MDPADRGYLAKLIAADTGMAAPDAERRVDDVAARAKQDINRARSKCSHFGVHGRRSHLARRHRCLGRCSYWGPIPDGREAVPALWDWGTEPRSPF